MTNYSKTITWTGKTGKTAHVTVALVTQRTIDADGDQVTVPCCDLEISATVDGLGCLGYGLRRVQGNPQAAAACGKLGIPADQLVLIDAAIAQIHATPEWQAKVAREEQAERDEQAYQAGLDRINRAMGR